MSDTKRKPTHIRPSARVRADRRLQPVSLRIADDELAMVRDAAAAANVTVSAYLRAAALGTASMPVKAQREILQAAGAAT
jgi:uncharacterized protein (DUF1778 family)